MPACCSTLGLQGYIGSSLGLGIRVKAIIGSGLEIRVTIRIRVRVRARVPVMVKPASHIAVGRLHGQMPQTQEQP